MYKTIIRAKNITPKGNPNKNPSQKSGIFFIILNLKY